MRLRWVPPGRFIPLIMRCAGELVVPTESLFLPPPPPPPEGASQPVGVSVPPPLIPTSSAHPRVTLRMRKAARLAFLARSS